MPLSNFPSQQPISTESGITDTAWARWFSLLLKQVNNPIVGTLQFTGGTGDAGTLSYNAQEETVDLIQNGAVLQLGQEVHFHVKNESGSTITNGTVVMATGTHGASGKIIVDKMDGTSPANAKYMLGVATEDITNGDDGKITYFGKVRGIDTSSWTAGDVLWVSSSTAGALTNTEPSAYELGMPIAFVINSHAVNGTIFVRSTPIDEHGNVTSDIPTKVKSYTVAGAPSASGFGAGTIIYVSNESGGAVLAFSDGTNWRRVTDRAIIS